LTNAHTQDTDDDKGYDYGCNDVYNVTSFCVCERNVISKVNLTFEWPKKGFNGQIQIEE